MLRAGKCARFPHVAGLLLAVAVVAAGCATGWGTRAPWEGPLSPQTQAVEKAIDRAFRHVRSATVAVAYLDVASGGKVLRN